MQEQKLRAQQAQQEEVGDGTEIVTKPLFAFGGFGGSKKAPKQPPQADEVVEKTTGVAVRGLGSIFGSQKSKKRGAAPPVVPA